jgi:hypothetical protein
MTTEIELTLEEMLVCAYQKNLEGVLRHKARVLEMVQPRDAEPPVDDPVPTPGTGAWAWQQMQRGPEIWVRQAWWINGERICRRSDGVVTDQEGRGHGFELGRTWLIATDWELCDPPKRAEATGPTREQIERWYKDAKDNRVSFADTFRLCWTAAREGMVPAGVIPPFTTELELTQRAQAAELQAGTQRIRAEKSEARARELEQQLLATQHDRYRFLTERDQLRADLERANRHLDESRADRDIQLGRLGEAETEIAQFRTDLAAAKEQIPEPVGPVDQWISEILDAVKPKDAYRVLVSWIQRSKTFTAHIEQHTKTIAQLQSDLAALRGEEWTEEWCKQTFESVAGGDLDVLAWGSYDEADQAQLVRFANACRVRPSELVEWEKFATGQVGTAANPRQELAEMLDEYRTLVAEQLKSIPADDATPRSDLPTAEIDRIQLSDWDVQANEAAKEHPIGTHRWYIAYAKRIAELARRGWIRFPAEDATVQQWWDADLQDLDRDWKSLDSDERSWAHRMFVTAWSGARAGSGSDGALTLAENNELARLFTAVRDCDSADNGDTWDALCAYVASLRADAVSAVAKERDEARAELEQVRRAYTDNLSLIGEIMRILDNLPNEQAVDCAKRVTAELTALRSRYSVPLTSEQREELARAIDEAFCPEQQGFPTWDTCLAADDDDELSDVGASRRADAFAAIDAIAPRIARVVVRELTDEEVLDMVNKHLRFVSVELLDNGQTTCTWDGSMAFARAIVAKATELEWKS